MAWSVAVAVAAGFYGASASTGLCKLTTECIDSVARTVAASHKISELSCDQVWSEAALGIQDCVPAASGPMDWHTRAWRGCVDQIMTAAARQNLNTCDPRAQPLFITLPANDSARCLDGSPYAFYVRPGDPRQVRIAIHGGGWCFNEEDCLLRSQMWLGSSKSWNLTNAGGGSGPDLSCGPLNDNCTAVFLPYCDGSSFSSARASPHPVPNSSQRVWFRGAANMDRVLDVLEERFSLRAAAEVVVTGGSAGGLSTLLHVDHVAARVPTARVVGAPDAGYFIDHTPLASTATSPRWYLPSWPDEQRYAYTMFNNSGRMSAECLAHYGATNEEWKCYMAQYAAPFVKQPFFAMQSRFDEWQLSQILRLPCIQDQSYFPPYKSPTCNDTERAAVQAYGLSLLEALSPVLNRTDAGLFLVSCIQHGVSASIGNVTASAALASWFDGSPLGRDTGYKWLDSSCGSSVCNPSKGCAPL